MSSRNEVIPMRQHDLHRYHTLHLVLEHRLTGAEAAQHLGLSLRHVRRLLARMRHAGRCQFGQFVGSLASERLAGAELLRGYAEGHEAA